VEAQDSKVKMSLTSVMAVAEEEGRQGQVLSVPRLLEAEKAIQPSRVLHQVLT
jgi:hypothetical protein